ncbi:fluoride efflux transporter CrcB [Hyphobacterium sp. CCMP332]|nr:fluoride efflux transporter CrcB [Hyphobacterium sp. CCMP332]
MKLLLVFIGGGLGSVFRYYLSITFYTLGSSGFPWPTFIVNIAGSLLLGFLITFNEKEPSLNQDLILLASAGFCGGFTTFSTFSYENYFLLKQGDFLMASAYIAASLIGGILAASTAYLLTKP